MIKHPDKKMRNITLGSLSPARRELVERMCEIVFGRIYDLPVRGGEPLLDRARVIERRRLDRGAPPRRKRADFQLRQEHIELLEILDQVQDGTLSRTVISDGLPQQVDVEQSSRE